MRDIHIVKAAVRKFVEDELNDIVDSGRSYRANFVRRLNEEFGVGKVCGLQPEQFDAYLARLENYIPPIMPGTKLEFASSNLVDALDALKPHEPAPSPTLFIFRDRFHAEGAGFRRGCHPAREDYLAYWPSLGEIPLRGLRPVHTIVNLYGRLPDSVEHQLRHRQHVFGAAAIWIEA